MGRKAKKRSGGHGSKGKGPSGAPREKKKSVDQLEGPMTSKSKGGPTSPVPVIVLINGANVYVICSFSIYSGVVQFREHVFFQRCDAVHRSVTLLQRAA